MKKLFALLFLLLPLFVFGQSIESNNLFKKGMQLFKSKNYKEAIPYFQKSDSLDKAALSESDKNYHRAALKLAESQNRLAEIAYENGNIYDALTFGGSAAEIHRKIYPDDRDYFKANSYYSVILANCYFETGNGFEAVRMLNMFIDCMKNEKGFQKLKSIIMYYLAAYYSDIGDYENAIKIGLTASEEMHKDIGNEYFLYTKSLHNLAASYRCTGNYDEAARFEKQALETMKGQSGKDIVLYGTLLYSIAFDHFFKGDCDEALKFAKESVETLKNSSQIRYALSLIYLARLYFQTGNIDDAIKTGTLSEQIMKNATGGKSSHYATILENLALFYLYSGNYDKAVDLYAETYGLINKYILKNFSMMSYRERANYWNMYSPFIISRLPYAACRMSSAKSGATMNTLAWDALTFSKGLLLNTELEIQKLIEKSGDTTLAMRYQRIKNNRSMLDALYQLPPKERKTDTDSLLKIIDKEERLLVESSKELGDYTKNLSIDFKDIQKNLKDNDLAIEFANFKDTALKQEIYIALVLKKGMTAPELVKLFDGTDFEKINSKEYYKKSDFYNLVWKKLETYLTGVKNVYFSPSGKFHTIGIEYLPDENRKIFAEKFNVYRLSSTRELALEHKQNPNNKAATYGGIKYDSDKDDGNVRGVATYLKGTKIESETVAKLLRSADFSVIALSDTLATEESFKNLSGSGLKILHIGTHGFYYAAENLENAGFSFFSDKQQSEEDKAMSCSGLLFAGANFALDTENRSALPEGDDGILTAKEISRLDFQGLDLVVLSACQTGLGEVTGEGVFGLQRGFKKAGAQTIIMSLWEVDDYATRLLMTEFFKGLTAGKSKREAFLSAQKFVKAKNSDPKYWAAFVMVDGE